MALTHDQSVLNQRFDLGGPRGAGPPSLVGPTFEGTCSQDHVRRTVRGSRPRTITAIISTVAVVAARAVLILSQGMRSRSQGARRSRDH